MDPHHSQASQNDTTEQPAAQQGIPSGGSRQVVPSNFTSDMLNDGPVKNTILIDGHNICLSIVLFIGKFFLLGLGDVLMANLIAKSTVESMCIGNRKLRYKSGGALKITMLAFVNWLLNIFTLGLWTFFGGAHKFYYSKLDERIYWGNPTKIPEQNMNGINVVWVPEDDCLGKIKYFSVYLGFGKQFALFLLSCLSIFTLGIGSPITDYFYYSNLYQRMELGRGKFCIVHPDMIGSINQSAKKKNLPLEFPSQFYESSYPVYGQETGYHAMFELRLKFDALFSHVVMVHMGLKALNACTCGIVGKCCMKQIITSFYNRAAKVDLIPIQQGEVPMQDVAAIV